MVDGARDVIGQFDDEFGLLITGRRFAGKDFHTRHPAVTRLGTDCLIQRHGVQQVQQLALVLVDTFDLHIEHGFGVDHNAEALINQGRQGAFVLQPLFSESLAKVCTPGKRFQLDQVVLGIVLKLRA